MRPIVAGLAFVACAANLHPGGSRLVAGDTAGVLTVYAVAADVLRVDFEPNGVRPTPTAVMDANGLRRDRPVGELEGSTLHTDGLSAELTADELRIKSADGSVSLAIDRSALHGGEVRMTHSGGEKLYGMRGYSAYARKDPRQNIGQGLQRNQGAPVAAGSQGDGGAPMAFTTKWGLFVDSVDGDFANDGDSLRFTKGSRKDVEAYIVLGPPKRTMQVVTSLSGRPPMMPKWSLGFINSQWGTTQSEVTSIIDEYRQKQIPIDAFVLDFDFKAWGEDDYGEWRWNSTNNLGNYEPNKYPDGRSGKFAADMRAKGIHLVGIMKPRILVQNADKSYTKAAAEAISHGWFLPNEKPYTDYFSHRPALDLDFSKRAVRQWYWEHAEGLFKTGISAWWNDEADENFDSLGFLHMQQSLYEGQRSVANERVWSINRNWYLGAQRYAYGTWSGDIQTGFESMQTQPTRMLAMTDLDQPHWSMDSGGFSGHPSPENYARWLELAAVVPIMRVHNSRGDHRQPWVYGPIAEAAAKKAIELRYSLLPYLYSCERSASETGVGMVRPLFWEFPDDPACANVTDSWMVGDSLLASPVLAQGQTSKSIYLPPGTWFDFHSGQSYEGGRTITVPVDSVHWSDLPLFARSGSIVAMGPVLQSTNGPAPAEMTIHVWPDSTRVAQFRVYDDDGHSYAYERGDWFSQNVTAKRVGDSVQVSFERPLGRFRPATRTYRLVIHGMVAGTATLGSLPLTILPENDATVVVPFGREQVVTLGRRKDTYPH